MNNKLRKIIDFFLKDLAQLFPYFLFFYVICLLLSLFSEHWKSYFNWPVFHFSLFCMVILYILNKLCAKKLGFNPEKTALKFLKVRLRPKQRNNLKSRLDLQDASTFKIIQKVSSYLLNSWIRCIIVVFKLDPQKKGDYIKIFIIGAILFYALYQQISFINFMVLIYGLRVMLEPLAEENTQVSALIAIIFLVMTAILSILQLNDLAEQTATAAYYLLCFSCLTGLINFIRAKPELYTAP